MTIEVAATIADLDATLPAVNDYISEGDDHIKLIKHSLKTTFPAADAVLKMPFSQLNSLHDYVDVKQTTVGTTKYNTIEGKNPLLLKNVVNGTADTDVPSIGQVKALIQAVLHNSIYKVGNYYISDDSTHPSIALGMAGTTWVEVKGFLAGAGTLTGGALDKPNHVITAGTTGGVPSVALTAANMPHTAIDLSKYTTADDGDHTHLFSGEDSDIQYNGYKSPQFTSGGNPSGHGRNGDQESDTDEWNMFDLHTKSDGSNTTHVHHLAGHLDIGLPDAQRQAVQILPTYFGTHVWRRTK